MKRREALEASIGTSVGLAFVVCWLRTAVDLVHKTRQQALAAEQERLLTLLKERQATLAYEQQRQMNALKDQFLLNVSHELRTPLTVLGSYLDLLEEHFEHLDSTERVRALKEALRGKEELSNLVDRVLDAASAIGQPALLLTLSSEYGTSFLNKNISYFVYNPVIQE